MSVERPTFHESWRRVAELRPRLRGAVQVTRHRFRGQTWRIARDPLSNAFFRMSDPAYSLVGLLDGRRSVEEAWNISCSRLGDEAPTQGEAIQLLGQLWNSNLLQGEIAGDTQAMFRRQRRRVMREMRGRMMSVISARLPLVDPNRFLDHWSWLVAWLFSPLGLALWIGLLCIGAYHLIERADRLALGAEEALSPAGIPLLYASGLLLKALHELGHAFACKTLGKRSGIPGAGEVHTLGVMLFFLAPFPYADVSSAWALRSKAHRIVVAAAGMIVDLAVAAIAAVVWSRTPEGSLLHTVAYNLIFLAGVSTIVFNANPLLRYDAYFILSDWLEIPNLAQRSTEHLHYLVKRRVFGVRNAQSPANTQGERRWLAVYAIASGVYRLFVSAAVIVLISQRFFILGALIAAIALVTWLVAPVGRFIHYLATSDELARVRPRAAGVSFAVFLFVLLGVGMIPMPDHARADGVVEPVRMAVIHAGVDGFVESMLPSGAETPPGSPALVRCSNDALTSDRDRFAAELAEIESQRRLALTLDPTAAQIGAEQAVAARDRLDRADRDVAALSIASPIAGTWIAPDSDRAKGVYVRRGDRLGVVADLAALQVRAVAGQDVAARLTEARPNVEIRAAGHPELLASGVIERIAPAGQDTLPSDALAFGAGGSIATKAGSGAGARAASPVFEVRIGIPPAQDSAAARSHPTLLPGQRVVVRFELPPKPLLEQWIHSLRRLMQRRTTG